MEERIKASYIPDLRSIGRQDRLLSFTGNPGDNIFINGAPKRCDTHFEALCGLQAPDLGEIKICGANPYELTANEAAAFRRDTIGGIPRDGGLIPELRIIDQIALPLKLRGIGGGEILSRVQNLTNHLLPMHDLYNLPGKCTARKQAHAAILRAVICEPKVIILNGFLDDLSDIDTDALWQVFQEVRPQNSVLIYLSGAPAPAQVSWTQQLRI